MKPGVNLIKLLQVYITTVAIVFKLRINGYTCELQLQKFYWIDSRVVNIQFWIE